MNASETWIEVYVPDKHTHTHTQPDLNNKAMQTTTDPLPAWKKRYSLFMVLTSIVGATWLLLQTIEIYSEKRCEGVSFPAFLLVTIGGVLWFTYGWFVMNPRDIAVSLSAFLNAVFGVLIIVGIAIYN